MVTTISTMKGKSSSKAKSSSSKNANGVFTATGVGEEEEYSNNYGEGEEYDEIGESNVESSSKKEKNSQVGSGNAGLRLLDALFDDVAYARYLLHSKLPQDALIKHKINWKDQQTGASLLHMLVYSDLVAPVKLLLEHGANPNIRNKHDETPLHWCARQNSMKCAQALIQFNADVNAIDESDSTPLHHAVSVGNVEITVLLLDKGADVHCIDKDNLSAIEVIAESQSVAHKAIMVILLRHYERIASPLPRAVKLKMSIQSAEIAAAATGMHYNITAAGMGNMGDRTKSQQSLNGTGSSAGALRTQPSSPPRTVYDQVKAGEAYEPDKSYKAMKMKAAQDAQLLEQRQNQLQSQHRQTSQLSLIRPPSSQSLGESFQRIPRPSTASPARASSPNSNGVPVFAIRHMNTTSSPNNTNGGGVDHGPGVAGLDTKRGNSFVAAALATVDSPMYAKSMSTSFDRHDHYNQQERALNVVELEGNDRDINQFVKSHVSNSSIAAARLQGMGMQAMLGSSNGVGLASSSKLGEGSLEGDAEVPMITQADIEPENSPLLQDFPTCEFIPFLPECHPSLGDYNPSHLDVLIEVEHCCDCQYHNDMTLRHDPKKYIQVANNMIHGLVKAIASNNFAVRVFAMRSKITSQKRIGALEVTISARIGLPEVTDADLPRVSPVTPQNRASMLVTSHNNSGSASNMARSNSMIGGGMSSKDNKKPGSDKEKEVKEIVREKLQMPKPRWQSTLLFSKLQSKSFPSQANVEQRAVEFLNAFYKEAYNARKMVIESRLPIGAIPAFSGSGEGDSENQYKRPEVTSEDMKAIKESYDKWVEKMKIPPIVERDPLDIDFPSELFPAETKKVSSVSFLDNYMAHGAPSKDEPLRHPPGPYLDIALAKKVSKLEFDRLTLQHFFVFDARPGGTTDDGMILEEDEDAHDA